MVTTFSVYSVTKLNCDIRFLLQIYKINYTQRIIGKPHLDSDKCFITFKYFWKTDHCRSNWIKDVSKIIEEYNEAAGQPEWGLTHIVVQVIKPKKGHWKIYETCMVFFNCVAKSWSFVLMIDVHNKL